ncbi:MAG TPA: response regulator [Anaerolineales bacterium]|nr:response regulator [Anaerolineales bacterium]
MAKPLALVVEDDPQQNQIFTLALKNSFEVEAISDGSQAISRLTKVTPRLIVLDINLPGASGAKVLEVIRKDKRFSSTRVILATANSQEAEVLREKSDIVLLKPISPIQLREFAERLKS